MGSTPSRNGDAMGNERPLDIYRLRDDEKLAFNVEEDEEETIPRNKIKFTDLELVVAHYTPPTFPLFPNISAENTRKCKESWKYIVDAEIKDKRNGISTSGITIFYKEFYARLALMDSSGKFEAVLNKQGLRANSAAKGALLLMVIKTALHITADTKEVTNHLAKIGKSHAKKNIRPWQYATLCNVLIQTISFCLGDRATSAVMEAWVHLFAFVMKKMLPNAIKHHIQDSEVQVNYAQEFIIPVSTESSSGSSQMTQQRTAITQSRLSNESVY